MSKRREALVDRMIRLYGFEHPIVIQFCELCESLENCAVFDYHLGLLVKCHEEEPVMD